MVVIVVTATTVIECLPYLRCRKRQLINNRCFEKQGQIHQQNWCETNDARYMRTMEINTFDHHILQSKHK